MSKPELLRELERKTAQADLPLKESATNLVFGKGNPEADILFIGEAPGRNEDEQGLPFVGKAGKQLDELLHLIGLGIDDVYIANVLKYRPPDNRDPNEEEIRSHTPFLVEQIKIIKPKIIATLGNFATKFVLSGFDPDKMKSVPGITKLRGKAHEVEHEGSTFKVFPLFHPAAVIYRREWKSVLEDDFRKMKSLIEQKGLDSF